jgi:hypothetical protein
MSTQRRVFALTLIVLALAFWTPPAHAAPKRDVLNLVAGTSSPDGITPISAGGRRNKNWVYPSFCVNTDSFSESFPISAQLTNGDQHAGDTINVHFQKSGSLAAFATVPSDIVLTDDGSVVSAGTFSVNATGLTAGTYTLTLSVTTSKKVGYANKTVQIVVQVGGGCVGTFVALFTGSQFDPLVDCNGLDVTTPTGGTFQIGVAGDGTAAGTAPPHLFYSFIFANTAANASTELDLSSTGLAPIGADAARASTFTTTGFTADTATFQSVTASGASCGTAGPCLVTINTGQTLWAVWAVDWSGLGASTAGISSVCGDAADAAVSLSTTLKSGALNLAVSNGGAVGYLGCVDGDADDSGVVDVGDVFYVINYLFASGPAPVCSGDANGDTVVDISDVFYLINYLFAAGPPPF